MDVRAVDELVSSDRVQYKAAGDGRSILGAADGNSVTADSESKYLLAQLQWEPEKRRLLLVTSRAVECQTETSSYRRHGRRLTWR